MVKQEPPVKEEGGAAEQNAAAPNAVAESEVAVETPQPPQKQRVGSDVGPEQQAVDESNEPLAEEQTNEKQVTVGTEEEDDESHGQNDQTRVRDNEEKDDPEHSAKEAVDDAASSGEKVAPTEPSPEVDDDDSPGDLRVTKLEDDNSEDDEADGDEEQLTKEQLKAKRKAEKDEKNRQKQLEKWHKTQQKQAMKAAKKAGDDEDAWKKYMPDEPLELLPEKMKAKREWMKKVKLFEGMSSSGKIIAFLADCLRARKCDAHIVTTRNFGTEKMVAAAGAVVVAKDDSTATEMFFIREGEAEVSIAQDVPGFLTLGPGRAFGEAALLTDEPRNSFVIAKTPMRLYVLTKADLQQAFGNFPGLEDALKSPLDEQKAARLAQIELAKTAAAAEAAHEADLISALQEPEEPAQEVLAGYTLFEVEQDSIRKAAREVLLGLGPMCVCIFERTSRMPIAWYNYDELKRWDFSANTLTFTLDPSCHKQRSGKKDRRRAVRQRWRYVTFETLQGEKICQQLTDTAREGWAAFVPTLAEDSDVEATERHKNNASIVAASRAAGEDHSTLRQRRRQAMLLPQKLMHLQANDARSPRLIFCQNLRDVCGPNSQLPVVLARMLELLCGDSLRAHGVFQDDVRSMVGMGFAVKRLRELIDGSVDGRVVHGWETAFQQAPSQVLASLLKQYLRDLPSPLFPYNKCVPLGVVLMEQISPVDAEDVEGHERAAVLKQQVALRLADGMQMCELLLTVKLLHMLSETANVSSVNGMTTAKLAIAMESVITWREEQQGGSAALHASNFNDSAALRALFSYLIMDGGDMFLIEDSQHQNSLSVDIQHPWSNFIAQRQPIDGQHESVKTVGHILAHGSNIESCCSSLESTLSEESDVNSEKKWPDETTAARGRQHRSERLERRRAEADVAQMCGFETFGTSQEPILKELLDNDDMEEASDFSDASTNRSTMSNDTFMLENQQEELTKILPREIERQPLNMRSKDRLRLAGVNFFEDEIARYPSKQSAQTTAEREHARSDQQLAQHIRARTRDNQAHRCFPSVLANTGVEPHAGHTLPVAFETDSDSDGRGVVLASEIFDTPPATQDYLQQYRLHLQYASNQSVAATSGTRHRVQGDVASHTSPQRQKLSTNRRQRPGTKLLSAPKADNFIEYDDFVTMKMRDSIHTEERDTKLRQALAKLQARGPAGQQNQTVQMERGKSMGSNFQKTAVQRRAALNAVDAYWAAMPETSESETEYECNSTLSVSNVRAEPIDANRNVTRQDRRHGPACNHYRDMNPAELRRWAIQREQRKLELRMLRSEEQKEKDRLDNDRLLEQMQQCKARWRERDRRRQEDEQLQMQQEQYAAISLQALVRAHFSQRERELMVSNKAAEINNTRTHKAAIEATAAPVGTSSAINPKNLKKAAVPSPSTETTAADAVSFVAVAGVENSTVDFEIELQDPHVLDGQATMPDAENLRDLPGPGNQGRGGETVAASAIEKNADHVNMAFREPLQRASTHFNPTSSPLGHATGSGAEMPAPGRTRQRQILGGMWSPCDSVAGASVAGTHAAQFHASATAPPPGTQTLNDQDPQAIAAGAPWEQRMRLHYQHQFQLQPTQQKNVHSPWEQFGPDSMIHNEARAEIVQIRAGNQTLERKLAEKVARLAARRQSMVMST